MSSEVFLLTDFAGCAMLGVVAFVAALVRTTVFQDDDWIDNFQGRGGVRDEWLLDPNLTDLSLDERLLLTRLAARARGFRR